jgi:serine protease Do
MPGFAPEFNFQATEVKVGTVLKGSDAEKAGIKAGDVIVALDGTAIHDSRDLAQKIGAMSPGTSVKLDVWRDGKQQTLTLALGDMGTQQAQAGTDRQEHTAGPRLGLSLAPSSDSKGVEVTAVDPNGPAAEHGMKAGDVIMNVAGTAVSTPGDVQKQIAQLREAGKHAVLMRIKSGDAIRYVALPLATG